MAGGGNNNHTCRQIRTENPTSPPVTSGDLIIMLVNPDYHLHQELFKLWDKIHNLRDKIIFLNDSLTDANYTIKKQKKEIEILKLQLQTINHPLKK